MNANECRKAGGIWNSDKKVCNFALKGVIANKGWIVQQVGDSIYIFDKEKYDISNPLLSSVGYLEEEETGWQPKSIQISKDTLAHMEESNVAIFLPEDEVKKKKWKNTDIRRAK